MRLALWIVGTLVGINALVAFATRGGDDIKFSEIAYITSAEYAEMQAYWVSTCLLVGAMCFVVAGVLFWAYTRLQNMRKRLMTAAIFAAMGGIAVLVVALVADAMTRDDLLRYGQNYDSSPLGEGIGLVVGIAVQVFIAAVAISAAISGKLKPTPAD